MRLTFLRCMFGNSGCNDACYERSERIHNVCFLHIVTRQRYLAVFPHFLQQHGHVLDKGLWTWGVLHPHVVKIDSTGQIFGESAEGILGVLLETLHVKVNAQLVFPGAQTLRGISNFLIKLLVLHGDVVDRARRKCRDDDDAKRAVVPQNEIFCCVELDSSLLPLLPQSSKSCRQLQVGQHGPGGIVDVQPIFFSDGLTVLVDHDDQTRPYTLISSPFMALRSPLEKIHKLGFGSPVGVSKLEIFQNMESTYLKLFVM